MTISDLQAITEEAVIANGGTTSDPVYVEHGCPMALELPAMTGTAMTFQVSSDGTTFVPLYSMDGASAYSVTIGDSARRVPLDPRVMATVRHLKIVSGSAEGAARTVKILTRPVY